MSLPMKLIQFSNEFLLQKTKELAQREREITLEILHHLREVERRHLYAEIGYSSLYEYCTKELKYSEASAQRRISSMRLLRELPELEEKVELGNLTLSAISQAQTFFRHEEIQDREAKKELM